jgi:hypothetical protein
MGPAGCFSFAYPYVPISFFGIPLGALELFLPSMSEKRLIAYLVYRQK